MSIDTTVALPATRSNTKVLRAVCVVLFTISWFAILGMRALYDPDEGRYAEIPREMLATGQWVIPHLNALAYLEKPPLQYWMTALSFRLFGESEFAARLWIGVCGYLSVLIVFLLARRLWGERAAFRAAVLLIGSSLFTLLAHQITLDMSLTLFMLAALACFIQAQSVREDASRNRHWMLGCWIAMAAAVLTKGLIGALVPAVTMIVYSIVQRDYTLYDRLNLRWGLPAFVLIVGPWFVLAARANSAFLNFFFVREHLERYLTTVEQRVEPWWFFIAVLAVGVLAWLPLAIRSIAGDWRKRAPFGQFDPVRLLWIWAVFVVVFFSASDSKLVPYILPAVPALALLCARRDSWSDARLLKVAVALSVLAAIAIGSYALHDGAPSATAHGPEPLAAAFRTPLLAMAGILAIACAIATQALLQRRYAPALAALCLGWFAANTLLLAGGSPGDRLFSSRGLARVVLERARAQDPIFSIGCYDQTLTFYLRRSVTLVAYRGELDLGLTQAPQSGIDTLEQFAARWQSLSQGYAVMHASTLASLVASGLPLQEITRTPTLVLVSRR
jgi:4-amino-4-deoxy-L-arabinose transferase-like glycosyltransferase